MNKFRILSNFLRLLQAKKTVVSQILCYYFFGFLFIYFVFSNAVTIPFVHHDQTRYFQEDYGDFGYKKSEGFDYENVILKQEGRFGAAKIEALIASNVNQVSDVSLVRFIVIIFMAVNLTLLVFWLVSLGLGSKYLCFFLSGLVFILPGIQNGVFIGNLPGALAILFSIISYLLLPSISISTFSSHWAVSSKLFFIVRIFLSLLMFTTALFMYQAWAYYFLVLTLTIVLFSDVKMWPKVKWILFRDFIFIVVSSAVYYILTKLLLHITFSKEVIASTPDSYRFAINSNIFEKPLMFLKDVIPIIFNLWNIYTNKKVSFFIIAFLFSGVIAVLVKLFFRYKKIGSQPKIFQYYIEKGITVIIIMFTINIVWLLSNTPLQLLRIFFPATAIGVFLVWAALKAWIHILLPDNLVVLRQKVVLGVTGFLFLTASVYVNYNMSMNVWNSNIEMMYMRSEIARHLDSPISRIHVVRPIDNGIGYNKLRSVDDAFNRKETDFWRNITEMVRIALIEILDKRGLSVYGSWSQSQKELIERFPTTNKTSTILVTQSAYGEPIYDSPNKVVVDLNTLIRASGLNKHRINYKNIDGVTESSYGARHPGRRAFDGNWQHPDSFWESGKCPQWVQVSYMTNQPLSKYILHTGEGFQRMPKSWKVLGSDDGTIWIEVDTRTVETDWKMNEQRTYQLKAPVNYKIYRFIFTEGNDDILRIYEIELL